MRLVLGAARRRARLRLPRARGAGRRPRGDDGRGARRRRRAPPGAGGVRRGGRGPVRLLHPGARRRDGRPARAHARTRPTTRSARRSRATSAAAPATRRSSTRCGSPPGARHERHARAGRACARDDRRSDHSSWAGRQSLPRADGAPKVNGRVRVLERPQAPGMLCGHTLRSPHAHARDPLDRHRRGARDARRARGAHARRRPGREALRARVRRPAGARDRPRPLLRRAGRARRRRAPRAGAARRGADRRSTTSRSSRSPTWSARPSEPTLHPERPTRGPRLPRRSAPNVVRTLVIRHGDSGARRARSSVEGDYETGIQDQAFLGPESGLAVPDGEGGVDIYVATQWLHVDRAQIAPCLGAPARAGARPPRGRRRRVRRPRGRLDADPRGAARAPHEPAGEDRLQPRGVLHRPRPPAPVADLGAPHRDARRAARLASRCGSSSTAAPTPRARPPSARTPPPSPAAPTRVPNALLEATVVYTNNPPCGAMRGFGAVQTCFAAEAQMDKLAATLGLDPVELRLRNALAPGRHRCRPGQRIECSLPTAEVIRAAAALEPPPAEALPARPAPAARRRRQHDPRRGRPPRRRLRRRVQEHRASRRASTTTAPPACACSPTARPRCTAPPPRSGRASRT